MNEYALYEDFDKGHSIHRAGLSKVTNYICGNLISWSPNRSFWEAEYNYVTKLMIVLQLEKKAWFTANGKKGRSNF